MNASSLEGRAYRAVSGQWSWEICFSGIAIVGAAGFDTEEAACEAMQEELDRRALVAR